MSRFRWFLCLAGSVAAALPIDYGREDRWTQEVVPSIVVGEPIYLATSLRPRILAILTVPSAGSKGSVIVVHGLGVHPDFGMINGIRTGLAGGLLRPHSLRGLRGGSVDAAGRDSRESRALLQRRRRRATGRLG